jgi:lipopolysaccharide transport system ATP-binding protein
MSDSDIAISAVGVSKRFRIYHERNQSIKQTLLRRRRGIYEEFWAVKDISLDIPVASTFGFIGENGSGKSTLLKCMAKILVPDDGVIKTNGSISALLELGAGFHPELSGRENIFLNGAILGISSKELNRKFDEIVAFSGIERFIDTPVKNYSSGMYVRLGFAIAINVSPDILLVDEVLAVGDAEFQGKCATKFQELKSSGCTIVVVSHAMGMIEDLCESSAWLEHGEIKAMGKTPEVIEAYLGHVARKNAPPPPPEPEPLPEVEPAEQA